MDELNEEEIDSIKDCISIFDKKGDDKVEARCIIDCLRSLGLNPLTKDVDKIIEDSNLKDIRVDFETFVPIFLQLRKKGTTASFDDMAEAIRAFDRDQSGMVTSAELRQILLVLGDKMTEAQIEAILSPHEDGNGNVPYEQVIKTVMATPGDKKSKESKDVL